MLKRFLAIIMIPVMGTIHVQASPVAEVTDVSNDIVSITTDGIIGENVDLLIVNPGFTKENALAGSDGAIQHIGPYVPTSSDYAVPIQIVGNVGGTFNVYVISENGEETTSFEFYNSGFKKKCIDDINAAPAGTDITSYFENLINAYSLAGNPMYTKLGSKLVSDAFLLLRDTKPDKKVPSDVSEVLDMINDSFILAIFNNGRADLAFSDGNLNYADRLSIEGTPEMQDYKTSITSKSSDRGVAYINNKLMSGGYKDLSEITKRFKSLVYRGVLIDYMDYGFGHIHGYFNKYRTAYEEAGFIIPSNEDEYKYLKLLEFKDDNLSDIATKFNAINEETTITNPSSKPSAGGIGGGFAGDNAVNYVNPEPQNSKPVFKDIDDSHWVKKHIDAVCEKGWINGYEDGSFRPDNMITRAEYTKLILTVFDIKPAGETVFEDVEKNQWYAPYVAKAQSEGIINGAGNYFYPENNLTRQDAAVIICRLLKKTSDGQVSFKDAKTIADYALPSVAYLSSIGVINGYSDNTFKPDGNITRAEVVKIIHTLYEKGGIVR